MKNEFDLDKIGKQLPYQVPPGFFEEITAQTLAEAKRRSSSSKSPSFGFWKTLSVAASVAVLLVAGYLLFLGRPQPTPEVAQAQPVHAPAPRAEAAPGLVALPTPEEPPKVASLPKQARAASPEKEVAPSKAPQAAKPGQPETLEQLLATLSDEELQQLATIAESEEYVYGESIEK